MFRWLRALVAGLLIGACAGSLASAKIAPGFQVVTVFDGLDKPVAIRFASDGRVFVIEKAGAVKVFQDLADSSPDVVVDLSSAVHSYWDRGLLGLAIDPGFPAEPYIYVAYTYNFNPFDPQSAMPAWPDTCPDPPGATVDGCVVNARVSRLEIGLDNTLIGPESVLLENRWCQQFPSHSIGDLAFDSSGALLVTAGDGAAFSGTDYGQFGGSPGSPTVGNPCGDPPAGQGGLLSLPYAEGGALRSQDLRTPGDALGFSGSVLRIDRVNGSAIPTNPLIGGDPADDRVIAYGLRNPYRMTVRPGTNEVWIADVGWQMSEEINVADPSGVKNFGWPCYEGPAPQPAYDTLDLSLCEALYADALQPAIPPYLAYEHGAPIDDPSTPVQCPSGQARAITGLAFYRGGGYPSQFDDALFFADYASGCLHYMLPDASGLPQTSAIRTLDNAIRAVDLQVGPGGDLYFAEFVAGEIRRIEFNEINDGPTAVATADATDGVLPLLVQFDGSASTDPDPFDTLSYDWDLDGDGQYDDSTMVEPSFSYAVQGVHVVGLRVTDEHGGSDIAEIAITAGNSAPTSSIQLPVTPLSWSVGDTIGYAGQGTDPEDGSVPPTSMAWDLILHHCPGSQCHVHEVTEFDGVATGSFTAPDHEWYSYLELCLTVTDGGFSGGGGELQHRSCIVLLPRSVALTFETVPPGLSLAVGSELLQTPATRTVIVGSLNSLSAPDPSGDFRFDSWSDGGAQSHDFVAPAVPTTLVATYTYHPQGGPAVPFLALGDDELGWSPAGSLDRYDVIRGDLGVLRASGEFGSAVLECVEDDMDESVLDYSDPPAGVGEWFLVRDAGGGSYDSFGLGQTASRDAGIAASPNACP